ncbi:MAG: hypothetical protein IJ217_00735 [Clostridia bacterium]|nr:hypothetical protein [Clostridia bacterium]
MGLFDFLSGNKNSGEVIKEYGKKPKKEETFSQTYSTDGDNKDFELVVEDVFTITGRGTIVTGRVGVGQIRVGDEVYIKNNSTGKQKKTRVLGVEMFRKLLDVANVGDNVGLLLQGIGRNDVASGDVISK